MAKDIVTDTLAGTILDLAKRVEALLACQQTSDSHSRVLVALAGVPGSGKSTVSKALMVELAGRGINDVAIVPMVRGVQVKTDSTCAHKTLCRMAFTTQKTRSPTSTIRHLPLEGVVRHSLSMRTLLWILSEH
jgi:putative protein kinase ArgK-like GTPase of G3E family